MKIKKIFMFMPFLLVGFLLTLSSCGNLGGGGDVSIGGDGKGEHNWTLVTGKPATCQEDGMKDYYTCSHCNEYKGTDGAIYTTTSEFILRKVDHNLEYVSGFTGCEGEGLKTHFKCAYCDTLFDEYKNVTTEEALKVVGQHNLNYVYSYEASCTSEGRVAYYECSKCMECFEDGNATVKINKEDTIIPASHNLVHNEEIKATCYSSGHKEYWYCADCNNYFLTEEASESVYWDEIYLSQLQHSFTNYDVESEETCETDRVEVAHCDHEGCDGVDTRTIENSRLGHNFVDGKCTNCQCDEFSEGLDYYIEINENDEAGIVITSLGTCTDRDIIIPEKLKGLPVIAIYFYNSIDIDSIYIPKTVIRIDGIRSSSLKEVILDENCALEELGYEAFRGCTSLESLSLPQSCQKIGEYAFYGCKSLKHINLDFAVEIGAYAFADCTSLEYVSIQRATKIGASAFYNTTGLSRVEMNQANALEIIGSYCFKYSGLTSISFPKSLSKISERAFEDCHNLETVVFQQGNAYIDQYAFFGCESLKEINLPKSLVSIGDSAFKDCKSLEVVKMDSTVLETVGKSAFEGCTSLKEIYMPNNTSVDFYSGAFTDDKAIETVYISNTHVNQWLTYNFSDETSNPLYVGDVTIKAYVSQVKDYVEIDGIDLTTSYGTTVPDFAFYNTKYNIIGLDSVIYAGDYAFAKVDSLVNIYLDKCAFIGVGAFSECENLETVRFLISDSETPAAICGEAFAGCSKITDLVIPNYFDEFGMGAFAGLYNLNSLSIPFIGLENKTSSDERQYPLGALFSSPGVSSGEKSELEVYQEYYKNSATTLTGEYFYMPSSLKHVSVTEQKELLTGSLMNVKLDSLTINANCLKLNNNYNISGDSLIKHFVYKGTLEKWFTAEIVGLTYTGDYFYTYEGGNLTLLEHIVIPANIVNINQNLFHGVQSVRSLTIDHKVLCNADYAFLCPNLYEIYITADPAEFNLTLTPGGYNEYGNASRYAKVVHYSSEDPSIFYEDENGFKFICHEDTKVLYGVPAPIDGYLELPESFTYNDQVFTEYTIAPNTFAVVNGLKELVIPNSVTDLAEGVFGGCSSLEKLTVPSMFGKTLYALFGCEEANDMDTSLEEVYVTNETTDIAERAFYNCDSLEVIHIEGTLEYVGAYAFGYCDSLEEVILADSIKTFSISVFSNSSSLKKVWLPASLENIERNIFYSSKDSIKELRTPFLGETAYSLDNCSLNYFFDNYNSVYNYVSKLETLIILGGKINGKGISKSNIVNLTIPVYSQEDIYFSVTDSDSFRDVENLYFAGTLEDWCHINNEIIDAFGKHDNFYVLNEKGEYYKLIELETLTIPSSVDYIAPYAFNKLSGVKHIEFAQNTNKIEIEQYAFANIEDAKTIVLPNNVQFVNTNVFANSLFEEVTLPNTFIGTESKPLALMFNVDNSDKNKTLKVLRFTNEDTFKLAWLEYFVAIEELHVTSKMVNVTYPTSGSHNYNYVPESFKRVYIDTDLVGFVETGISALSYPNVETYIKNDKDEYYNIRELTKIIIPEGTTTISSRTFNSMSNTMFYIPSSVTYIASNAFSGSDILLVTGHTSYPGSSNWAGVKESDVYFDYTLDDVYETQDYRFLLKGDNALLVTVLNKDIVHAVVPYSVTVNNKTYIVNEISSYTFSNLESLESVDLPDGLTTIGEYCFSNSLRLKRIEIPSSVTYIGQYVFGKLDTTAVVVYLYSQNTGLFNSKWNSHDGGTSSTDCVYNLTNTISTGTHEKYYYVEDDNFEYIVVEKYRNTTLEDSYVIVSRFKELVTEVTIPDTLLYQGKPLPIKYIGSKSFDSSNIEKVVFGQNIESVRDRAFRNCDDLVEIVFNDNLTTISMYGFSDCDALETVTLNKNLTILDNFAFRYCSSLSEVNFEEGCQVNIWGNALSNTAIEFIYLPDTVGLGWALGNIFADSFTYTVVVTGHESSTGAKYEKTEYLDIYYGVLESQLLELNGLTYYLDTDNNTAMVIKADKTLTSVTIPEKVTYNEQDYIVNSLVRALFKDSELEQVTIPSTITEIASYAFANTKMTELTLNHIVKIDDSAFVNNKYLTKVVISETLEEMGFASFAGCTNITYLDLPFIGANRDETTPCFTHIQGGYYGYEGVLQGGSYQGVRFETLIIRNSGTFYGNCFLGVEADNIYFYGEITGVSTYLFGEGSIDDRIERVYVMNKESNVDSLYSIANKFQNYGAIVLFAGQYKEDHYTDVKVFSNYSEDTYALIDGITYMLVEDMAVVIHIESKLLVDEELTLPETITHKEHTYNVVEELPKVDE